MVKHHKGKMILASCTVTLLLAMLLAPSECKSNGKENFLDGQLIETSSLPLELTCPKKYKYILIGGVTFNGTDAPKGMETQGKNECDEQLADPKQSTPGKTSCLITFGGNTSIGETGVIRLVFKCLTSKGSRKPGKEWTKTTEQSLRTATSSGKKIIFICDGAQEIIEIQTVSKNGEPLTAEEVAAYHQKLLPDCYRQAVEKMKKGIKANMICEADVSSEKDRLTMEYYCVAPVKPKAGTTFVTV